MAGALTRARRAALSWRSAPVLLAGTALLLFSLGQWHAALWDQDEAKYTEVAREMVLRGDPLTPHVNGTPWFVHPPLHPWLVAATGAVFGFSEFTARIWTAVFGAAGVVVTYLLGRRLYDRRTGLIAGIILLTTLEYVVLSRLVTFDVPLVVFMLLALYMVLVAMDAETADPRAARGAYRWAFIFAGLATMTKGPIGLLLPGMIVAAWWLLLGGWWSRLRRLPWEGPLLYAAVGLSWYVLHAAFYGERFLQTAVGYYMLNRFFGVVENQPGPWYYYLPVLLIGGYPWSAFLPATLVYHWRRVQGDRASLLLVLWVGITVVFYSIAGTKLPNYILPVFPVAAIGLGRLWVASFWEADARAGALLRWGGALLAAVVGLLILAGVIFGRLTSPGEFHVLAPYLLGLAALLAGGALLVAGLLGARRLAHGFVALVGTSVLTLAVIIAMALTLVEPLRPIKPLALMLRDRLQPDDRIVGVALSDRASLLYYTGRAVIWVEPRPDEVRRAICGPGRVFVAIVRPQYDRWARAEFASDLVLLAARGDVVVLETARPVPCPS